MSKVLSVETIDNVLLVTTGGNVLATPMDAGGLVTWATDLLSSTSSQQWVVGISGANGTGATCTLRSGTTIEQTQSGTVLAPVTCSPLQVFTPDATRASYGLWAGGTANVDGTTFDTVFYYGYNANPGAEVLTEPISRLNVENNFEQSPGVYQVETYFETTNFPGVGALIRPFGFVTQRASGAVNVATSLSYTTPGQLSIAGGAAGSTQQARFTDGTLLLTPTNYVITGNNGLSLNTLAGPLTCNAVGAAQYSGGTTCLIAASGGRLTMTASTDSVYQGGSGQAVYLAFDTHNICDHTTTICSVMANAGGATTFTPETDATGSLGTNTHRWNLIRGVTITSGDLALVDEERGADWLFREQQTFILAVNRRTGERRKLLTAPLDAADENELRANDPRFAVV